jgi:hypothetical protein
VTSRERLKPKVKRLKPKVRRDGFFVRVVRVLFIESGAKIEDQPSRRRFGAAGEERTMRMRANWQLR